MEEAGLSITGEPKLLLAQDILKADKHVVCLTYAGEAIGEVKLSEEHSKHRWLTRGELSKLEPMDKYIQELLDRKLV